MSTITNLDMQTAMSGMAEQNIQAQKQQIQMLGASKDPDAEKEKKLREASEGFESIFIQKMWEQMRASLPKDGLLSSSKEEKFWQSMYDQELAKSMASAGGIGLADMMVDQMKERVTGSASSQSKESQSRNSGLNITPAPLLSAPIASNKETKEETSSANSIVDNQKITTQQVQQVAMLPRSAPLMNMDIYDSGVVEYVAVNTAPLIESQKTDNATPSVANSETASVAEEQVAPQPIVTRVTYTTNMRGNSKSNRSEQLLRELLTPQQVQQAPIETAKKEETLTEDFNPVLEEMEPIVMAKAEAELLQSTRPAIEQDILSGITRTYFKKSETNALRSHASSPELQAILQPTFAGGPDMQSPQAVFATSELGYLNPEKGSFQNPVDGKVTSGFGWRLDPINGRRSWHNGIDITAPANSPVKAAEGGVVSYAGYDKELGNMVIIHHSNGLSSVYGHNSELNVKSGDFVEKGTEIAKVGSTGRVLGNHLHFEIRKEDMPINPENVLIQNVVSFT